MQDKIHFMECEAARQLTQRAEHLAGFLTEEEAEIHKRYFSRFDNSLNEFEKLVKDQKLRYLGRADSNAVLSLEKIENVAPLMEESTLKFK
jgi:hypothetical protein